MRVLMCGGGTAGHINPALEIAEKIRTENPDAHIEYVGTSKGLETKLVPKAGYKLHFVKVEGIKRKLTVSNIKAVIHAVTSVYEAEKIVKNFRPDIVIGTGGYACWPTLKAAANLGIPTLVHESNAIPGLTTRMLTKYVDKVLLNFEESREYFESNREKLVCVGNPVNHKMFKLKKSECRTKLQIPQDAQMLLSYGGSLGAKKMNEIIFEMISRNLLPENVLHIHATGAGYWESAKEYFLSKGFSLIDQETLKKDNTEIRKYIYNMPEVMACADIVVCRAGAMTVSEIAAMGKCAIFIPSPNVTDDQQYKNAMVLKRAGVSDLIKESELDSVILSKKVKDHFLNNEKTEKMSHDVKKYAKPDCLDIIYGIVKELAEK